MIITVKGKVVFGELGMGPNYELADKVWKALNSGGVRYSDGGEMDGNMVELVKVVKVGDRDFSDIIQELMSTIQGELLLTTGEDLSGLNEGLR